MRRPRALRPSSQPPQMTTPHQPAAAAYPARRGGSLSYHPPAAAARRASLDLSPPRHVLATTATATASAVGSNSGGGGGRRSLDDGGPLGRARPTHHHRDTFLDYDEAHEEPPDAGGWLPSGGGGGDSGHHHHHHHHPTTMYNIVDAHPVSGGGGGSSSGSYNSNVDEAVAEEAAEAVAAAAAAANLGYDGGQFTTGIIRPARVVENHRGAGTGVAKVGPLAGARRSMGNIAHRTTAPDDDGVVNGNLGSQDDADLHHLHRRNRSRRHLHGHLGSGHIEHDDDSSTGSSSDDGYDDPYRQLPEDANSYRRLSLPLSASRRISITAPTPRRVKPCPVCKVPVAVPGSAATKSAKVIRRFGVKKYVEVEALPKSLQTTVVFAADKLPQRGNQFYPYAPTELVSNDPSVGLDEYVASALVYQGDQFEIRVVGMSVADLDVLPFVRQPNELVLFSFETDDVTTTNSTVESVPLIHFDCKKERTLRHDFYQPIADSKSLVLRHSGIFTRRHVNLHFKVLEMHDVHCSVRSAIDAVDGLAPIISSMNVALPYLSVLTPSLTVAGKVGRAALQSYAIPENILEMSMSFRLLERGRESWMRSGEYLSYGWYFFLSEPVAAKLFASTITPMNVRLMMRCPKTDKYVPLTHVSYIVVRVGQPLDDLSGMRSGITAEHALRLQHLVEGAEAMDSSLLQREIIRLMHEVKGTGRCAAEADLVNPAATTDAAAERGETELRRSSYPLDPFGDDQGAIDGRSEMSDASPRSADMPMPPADDVVPVVETVGADEGSSIVPAPNKP